MKILLDGLLPRLFPGWVKDQHFQCVPHEGKKDLERSIPRKLRGWLEPNARFVVVCDNDGGDCMALKARLKALCVANGHPDTLVRLVCQELESWYLGDLTSLAIAFADSKLDTPVLRKRFANPDARKKPASELSRLIPTFQKSAGARIMADFLQNSGNLSHSFAVFIAGLQRLARDMGYQGNINNHG